MAANGMSSGTPAVPEEEARAEAERLMTDPRLHVSERHRAFLRYIIDALFEGRSDAVKAYSIAIDVFNRPATFDPSSDPIVRIEATRLREALAKYYEQVRDEGVRLDIARGRYVPVFFKRDQPPCPLEDHEELEEVAVVQAMPVESAAVEAAVHSRPRYLWGGLFCALGLAALAVFHLSASAPRDSSKPFVSLSLDKGQDTVAGDAFLDSLAVSIARFGTVRLRSRVPVRPLPEADVQGSYDIRMRYGEDAEGLSLWWQVSDAATGEAVWTDQEERAFTDTTRETAMRQLIYGVSQRLAGPSGIVNAIELRRDLPASTTGNICVLRSDFGLEMTDPAGLKVARHCLEKTVKLDPADADASAALSRVYLWMGQTTADDSYFGRAIDLANRAASISPNSPRAALAQLSAQYQVGQSDAAIAAGRRGVASNPENADLAAELSMAVFMSGQWEDGVRLARNANEIAGQPIRDASFVMILDAYRRSSFAEAVFLARQLPAPDTATAVLKLAAVARLGQSDVTARETAYARMQHPDLDRTVATMFSGMRYDRGLEIELRTGIEEAGLQAPPAVIQGSMLQ